uniref:Uncharacterized protein n=1 Tax=Arundo donax TaxID=35708 RepID=A0A0A9BP61_ARUDO
MPSLVWKQNQITQCTIHHVLRPFPTLAAPCCNL